MKYLNRHILIWLFLLYGTGTYASHVLGGEISYKHIKNNQYKVTINIYRDCNGCKINGTGGGNSSENCSEIDFVYVKGLDKTLSKETKFALSREKIEDISPFCHSKISTCKSGSNSIYGFELQQFSSIIDLDDSRISGFCDYYIYVSISERNTNITTGQAKQNFCIDAYIQTCISNKNNSPEFTSRPSFLINSGKTQYQSSYAIDVDNDSLVYSLTPALSGIDKTVNYNSGFNFLNPLSVYCTEMPPCNPDRSKETGFFIDKLNGSIIFIPVKASEIGVVALKIEEYRKISGKWELIGYIKRDIQITVKTSDGNNPPKFLNQEYYEICEEEEISIKIESKDDRITSTSDYDTVNYFVNSSIIGSKFSEETQANAPFNYGLFKWKPSKGSSQKGLFTFSISASDNFCPLNEISTQIITIKVKPKEELHVSTVDLGCGNFEIKSSAFDKQSKLLIKIISADAIHHEMFKTSLPLDTVSFLPRGKYILKATLSAFNGCETILVDTIYNFSPKTNAFIFGEDNVCKETNYDFTLSNIPSQTFNIKWVLNKEKIGTGIKLSHDFIASSQLYAIISAQKGKWFCIDSIKKQINIIKLPEIIGSDVLKICHRSGNLDLKTIEISPDNGTWSSTNSTFNNGLINTDLNLYYYDDTVALNYEITQSGCKSSKNIELIIQAVPEFELSSISICEMKNAVRFQHLIQKPYRILDYTYNWELPSFPDKIKDENGFKLFYPTEIGFGIYTYYGEVISKNGCKNQDTATIEITPAVHINFEHPINLCQGSGLNNINEISGVKPNNGNWSFRDFELFKEKNRVSTDSCGQFEAVYVYDNYGCYDTKNVIITIDCKPKMQITGLKNNICDAELKLPMPLFASPSGGIWEGNYVSSNYFFPPSFPEIKQYSLSYIIGKGLCKFKETKTVTVIPSPIINLNPDKFNYCQPEPINISGEVLNTDKLTIQYFDKAFGNTIAGSEIYTNTTIFNSVYNQTVNNQTLVFTSTNKDGCSTTKDISINVFYQPVISPLNDTFICENSDFIITPEIKYEGNEPLSYSWLENAGEIEKLKNLKSNKMPAGMHHLIFKSGNEYCSDSKSTNIEIKPLPMVDFNIMPTNTTTIMQPTFWFINQSGLNQSWLWDFGTKLSNNFSVEQSPKYSYTDTGNYNVSLTGTDIFGCSNTINKTVIVRPDLLIFIPNAFTPNNKDEEKNNVFSVSLLNYNTYSIDIFNRWGHRVFYSEDPKETWDGKSGDAFCTPDIYFYSIKINSITNNTYHYRGTITLIK